MATIKIYGLPLSSYVRTARLACHEKGAAYELVPGMPGSAEVPHPFGKIPYFTHGDLGLHETPAIVRYLDRSFGGTRLWPGDARGDALVDQWVGAVCDYLYGNAVPGVVLPTLGFRKSDEAHIAAAVQRTTEVVEVFDRTLASNRYLAGDTMSAADLFAVPILFMFPAIAPLQPLAARMTNIQRWAREMGARPSIAATDPQRQKAA